MGYLDGEFIIKMIFAVICKRVKQQYTNNVLVNLFQAQKYTNNSVESKK